MVELLAPTLVHHEDPVRVNDGSQSMRDQDDRAALEACSQLLLDYVVRLQIDVGSGLVEHENLRLLENCSREADELLLANGEQVVALRDDRALAVLH